MFDPDDSKTLVTCGKEHIHFWRLHNTRLERKNGYFEVHLIRFLLFGYSSARDQAIQKGHHCHYSGLDFKEETLGPAVH